MKLFKRFEEKAKAVAEQSSHNFNNHAHCNDWWFMKKAEKAEKADSSHACG
jgi:hypothetical protein